MADVFPDTQKLVIQNRAKVAGGLRLSLGGTDSSLFKLSGTLPSAIPALDQVEVKLEFAPQQPTAKDARATLTVDDEYEGTENPVVALIGATNQAPAQPTLETAPQKKDLTGYSTCTQDSLIYPDCTLEFPETMYGQSAVLELKLRNRGCPALKVTGLRIDSDSDSQQDFSIDVPANPPSPSAPLFLSTADGTEETTVRIRFAPSDDGTGNTSRRATLTVLSNDPLNGTGSAQPALISIEGQALAPAIYATPNSCDFTNSKDPCGNANKVTGEALFRIVNSGNIAVKLRTVKFLSTGTTAGVSGRFSISKNIEGQTLQPGEGKTLTVTHTDKPVYVSDQIEIRAVIAGDEAVSAGLATLAVYGGTKPCLSTNPADAISFSNPAEEFTAQTVQIRNGAGCGVLTLAEVSVDSSPFFSLIEPKVAPNAEVAPGSLLEATVQYQRPPSGGMQIGTLRIKSNDTDYGPPQYKLIQLFSQSPLDQVPIATLSGCTPPYGNDPQCLQGSISTLTVRRSTLDVKEVLLSGARSVDDKTIKAYRFRLLPPLPAGVTTAALANHDIKVQAPTTTLALPEGTTGVFRVSLEVWDDRDQKSANTAIFLVSVYP